MTLFIPNVWQKIEQIETSCAQALAKQDLAIPLVIARDIEVLRADLHPKKKGLLLKDGLVIEGRVLKRAHAEWVNEDQLRIVLTEGMKRQVRKMCEAVGLQVRGLKRVRIGNIMLGNLPEGRWRFLGPNEKF